MIVKARIDENGSLTVSDPQLFGKEVEIHVKEEDNVMPSGTFNWEGLKAALDKADQLDIPRRSTEEIMRDIHEIRERD